MPIDYDIEEEQKLVIARGSGIVVANEILKHMDELAADERYVAPMKKLVDYSLVEHLRLSEEDAWQIVRKRTELSDRFRDERTAFISPDDATFAATRVHESLMNMTEANTVVVCRTFEDAVRWLGVKLDQT